MMIRPVILFCLLFTAFFHAESQTINFETADGLPQSFVYAIEQDTLGRMWFGTGNGIAYYNGLKISEEDIPFDMGNRFISSIARGKNDELWFGHYAGNVSIKKPTGWKIYSGISNTKVIKLISSFKGLLIVHQNAIGLLKDEKTQEMFAFNPGDNLLIQDAVKYNTQIILATNQGLYRYLNHSFESLAFEGENISSVNVIDDELFVGTASGVLYQWKLDGEPKKLRNFNSQITCVEWLNEELWVGTKTGAHLINTANFTTNILFEADRHITDLTTDPIGNIWMSSYGEGLFMFPNEQFSLLSSNARYIINDGYEGFFGGKNKEVIHLTKSKNQWQENVFTTLPPQHQISSLTLYKNKLFIGTEKHGVYIYDLSNRTLTAFEYNNFLSNKKIHTLYIDQASNWWIATALSGVVKYNPENSNIEVFDTSNGLTHNDIYHIVEDHSNYIWMAPKGSGLTRLKENTFNYFTFNEGLNDLDFSSLTVSHTNNTVVSSVGGGIGIFKDSVFHTVNYADGLPSNFVQGIQHITENMFWVTTPDKVSLFDANRLSFRNFDKRYFKQNLAFSEGAIATNNKIGAAIFRTNKGLLIYQKRLSKTPEKVIDVAIQKFVANNKALNFNQQLTLPYKRQNLNARLGIVSYGQTSPLGIEYKLFEDDTTWIGPVYQNQINFAGLQDGQYKVSIRVANQPETTKHIAFTILKPYWKTWWFILLCILALSVLVYLVFKIRLYRLKQYNLELEEKVIDRTEQLANRNKQLEQFTYTISHDLKNPAVNLVELVKILEPGMQEHPEQSIFAMLKKTTNNMYNTLIELLNVLKATQEKGLKLEELNINDIIEDVCISIKHSIESKEARIEKDLKQETFIFHKPHLQSIVYNLISNAIKYAKPDVSPVIRITSYATDKYHCFEVSDNGLGIDMQKDSEKLFGMFQRLHDHVEGTGVGLHLIHSIIKEAGGEILVASELNVGTRFTVKLLKNPIKDI